MVISYSCSINYGSSWRPIYLCTCISLVLYVVTERVPSKQKSMQAFIGMNKIYMTLGRFAAGSPWTLHWILYLRCSAQSMNLVLSSVCWHLTFVRIGFKGENREKTKWGKLYFLSRTKLARVYRHRNICLWLLSADKGKSKYSAESHEINPNSHNEIYAYACLNLFKIRSILWMRDSIFSSEALAFFCVSPHN